MCTSALIFLMEGALEMQRKKTERANIGESPTREVEVIALAGVDAVTRETRFQ